VLSGPPGVAELPFLHPGDHGHAGETSPAPNGRRPGRQLDAGSKGYRVYTFSWNSSTLATVLVPSTNSPDRTWLAGEEYWFVYSSVATQMSQNNASYNGMVTVKLSQDNEWSTGFQQPEGTIQETTGTTAYWEAFEGTARHVFANTGRGLGLSFEVDNGRITWIYWFNSSEGNFYFSNTSQVGAELPLTWAMAGQFAFSYYAPLR
jgi:hypothetical protein